ncbi:phytanoyl-CoA dioxygenase family protein [Mycobacterium sp. NPDC003323]
MTLTAWVALTDVPAEQGCLQFLTASHEEHGAPIDGDLLDARPELRWRPRVSVPLRAGDCTFHHCWLVHGAGPNLTDHVRLSLATVYVDAASRYRPDPEMPYQDPVPNHEPEQPLDDRAYPRIGGRADV